MVWPKNVPRFTILYFTSIHCHHTQYVQSNPVIIHSMYIVTLCSKIIFIVFKLVGKISIIGKYTLISKNSMSWNASEPKNAKLSNLFHYLNVCLENNFL